MNPVWAYPRTSIGQNQVVIIHFPVSSGVSEPASEWMSAASSVELSSPLSFCLSHFLSFFISFFLSFFLFFPFLFFRSLFFFSYLPFVSCLFSDYSHTNSCRHRIRITSTQNFELSIRTPKKGRSKVFLLFVNSVFIFFHCSFRSANPPWPMLSEYTTVRFVEKWQNWRNTNLLR